MTDINLSIANTVDPHELTIEAIKSSKMSIKGCVYKLNHHVIYQELERALSRGVVVELVFDYKNKIHNALVHKLRGKGASVYFWNKCEKLHAKFAIFDDKRVLTGSFNWTQSNKHKTELIIDTLERVDTFINLHAKLVDMSTRFLSSSDTDEEL